MHPTELFVTMQLVRPRLRVMGSQAGALVLGFGSALGCGSTAQAVDQSAPTHEVAPDGGRADSSNSDAEPSSSGNVASEPDLGDASRPPASSSGSTDGSSVDSDDCEQRTDPALLTALRELLSLAADTPLADYHFAAVQWLRVHGAQSLEGLECFPNLYSLELLDGPSVDVSPLGETAVQELRLGRLSGNVELSQLAGLALDALELTEVELEAEPGSLDGSVLAEALLTLRVESCELDTVQWVAGLTSLQILEIPDNAVSDLGALSGALQLIHLDVSGNQITDLNALGGLNALTAVDASHNAVLSLDGFGNSHLERLTLFDNQLQELGVVSLPSLTVLSLRANELVAGPLLSDFPALVELDLSDNPLERLSIEGAHGLQSLQLDDTLLSGLDGVEHLSELRSLTASRTALTELEPLADLQQLRELMVRGSLVADLTPLSALPAVTVLDVSETRVTNLSPLSGWVDANHACGILYVENLDLDGTSNGVLGSLCSFGWEIYGDYACGPGDCRAQ